MVRDKDIPDSVRIRTDEDNKWRYDEIQRAAEFYDCNRSDAIAYAAGDVVRLAEAAQAVLERDDLTKKQQREIANTLSCRRSLKFEVTSEVSIDRDD
jgi:hypothetical protein